MAGGSGSGWGWGWLRCCDPRLVLRWPKYGSCHNVRCTQRYSGDYRVIWEIADQITRATVNCFLVTCQHRDNINTTEEEGELMQHLADYSGHNNISDVWVDEESRISIMKCQKWYLLGCLHLLKVLIHTLHYKLVQKCDIWVVNKPPAISAPRLNSVKFDMRGLNIYHINQSKQCNTTLHCRCGQLQVELNHFIRIQCTSGLEEF